MLDAQRQEYELEDQYATTQEAAADSLVSLYKGLGGGWEKYQDLRRSASHSPPSSPPSPACSIRSGRTASNGTVFLSSLSIGAERIGVKSGRCGRGARAARPQSFSPCTATKDSRSASPSCRVHRIESSGESSIRKFIHKRYHYLLFES
ncbi:MAG: hypothetical protein WDN69_16590 [Aliidongia sp.]